MIAKRIKNLIVANQLKPGDRLPTEHEMAAQFGVSRVSVREATSALGFLGVLRSAPRRGLTVGEFDAQRATEQLGFPLVLTDHPKSQLLHTRIIIETGALPHVAKNMAENPALYDQLAALHTDPGKEGVTLDERIATDIAFHRALLTASDLGPGRLQRLAADLFRPLSRGLGPAQHGKEGARTFAHSRCVRRGDVESACAALRRHLEYYNAYL